METKIQKISNWFASNSAASPSGRKDGDGEGFVDASFDNLLHRRHAVWWWSSTVGTAKSDRQQQIFFCVPPESSSGKKMAIEEHNRKKPPGAVKLSPWTLARLDAEEVSKAAAQARKKSKILQPVVRRECLVGLETDNSFGNRNGRISSRIDHRRLGGENKRGGSSRLPRNLSLERLAKISASATDSNESDIDPETCTNLAPLQYEARSAFHTSRAMSCTEILASSSPESSLESPDQFEIASGTEAILASSVHDASQKEIRFSRSTSDGYEASGGEDSDRVPSRIVHRASNWSSLAFNSARSTTIDNITKGFKFDRYECQ